MTLHPIPLNFLKYEENFIFFFYQCSTCWLYFKGSGQKYAKVSTRARAETSCHLDTIINPNTTEQSIESAVLSFGS